MKYLLSVLLYILFGVGQAFSSDSLKVIVLDEKEAGLAGVNVSIEGYPEYTSDKTGKFFFKPTKKLVFPFEVKATKEGYELEEFMFYEEDSEIEIRMAKAVVKVEEMLVRLITEKNKPLTDVKLVYKGKNYSTDKQGDVKISEKVFDEKLLTVKGFKFIKTDYIKKNNIYTVHLTPALADNVEETAKQDNGTITPTNVVAKADTTPAITEDVATAEKELQEIVFKEYSQGFENISQEIFSEQKRLLQNNKKIRDEIEKMTNKLKNEKNLSEEQRAKLKNQIDELEKTLVENAIAYNKAEEKTISMIQDLKLLVMQKDSLNALTLKKLKAEEEKRIAAEMKNKRTIIIFTIITISLTFLAVAFYGIARKMRVQKKALMKADEELRLLKEQMGPGNELVNP